MVGSRRRALRRNVGQRILVHTTDDRTIDGVLTGAWNDCLGLSHASVLQPGDAPDLPLGGNVLIPTDNISLVQVDP